MLNTRNLGQRSAGLSHPTVHYREAKGRLDTETRKTNRYCKREDERNPSLHYWQTASLVKASWKTGPCLNPFKSHTMSYWTEKEETWGGRTLIEGYLFMFTEKTSFSLFYTVCAGLATRTIEHIYSTSIWRPTLGKILCTDRMAEDRYKKNPSHRSGPGGGQEVRYLVHSYTEWYQKNAIDSQTKCHYWYVTHLVELGVCCIFWIDFKRHFWGYEKDPSVYSRFHLVLTSLRYLYVQLIYMKTVLKFFLGFSVCLFVCMYLIN